MSIFLQYIGHNLMIKKLAIRDNSSFVYLTKPMLQLLRIIPKDAKFLFTIKNKILYIDKVSDEQLSDTDMQFVTKIRKIGSGYGIYMAKSILELIDVNPLEDFVDMTVEEQTIVIKKAEA